MAQLPVDLDSLLPLRTKNGTLESENMQLSPCLSDNSSNYATKSQNGASGCPGNASAGLSSATASSLDHKSHLTSYASRSVASQAGDFPHVEVQLGTERDVNSSVDSESSTRTVPEAPSLDRAAILKRNPEFRQYVNGHIEDFKVQFASWYKMQSPGNLPQQDPRSLVPINILFYLNGDLDFRQRTKHQVGEGHKIVFLHWAVRQPAFNERIWAEFKAIAALDMPRNDNWIPGSILYSFMDMRPRAPGVHASHSTQAFQNDFWIQVFIPLNNGPIESPQIKSGHKRQPCLLTVCGEGDDVETDSSFPPYGIPSRFRDEAAFQVQVDADCRQLAEAAGGYFGGQIIAEYESVISDCATKREILESWPTERDAKQLVQATRSPASRSLDLFETPLRSVEADDGTELRAEAPASAPVPVVKAKEKTKPSSGRKRQRTDKEPSRSTLRTPAEAEAMNSLTASNGAWLRQQLRPHLGNGTDTNGAESQAHSNGS